MSMKYKTGSIWRKWDLHVHTPLSVLNNQFPKLQDGQPDWEKYITALEGLDFATIGVTDYFSIEGYKKVLEYKGNGRLSNFESILPNIEFRLSNVISSRRDGDRPRRLNFHVIFSDELEPEIIEEHFLHDIHFFYEGNPQDKDEKKKLKLSNIEALGEKLIKQHEAFQDGRSALEIGMMNAVVNHEEISEILTGDSRFKGKYVLIFPEELSNLIDWDGQDHHVRKSILQKSDMVFSSNPRTVQWCLGKDPYQEGEKAFLNEFKTLKPCIHGSDAHDIESLGNPCIKRGDEQHQCSDDDCDMRYCWVKADPTFEGLRQLLYEPEDRVAIQEVDPTPPRSDYTLTKFLVPEVKVGEELAFSNTEVELNGGLVAVTGGKGAGKTALVDLIANCFVDRVDCEDNNSFVKRISDQGSVETKLEFKGGANFEKESNDDDFFEDSELIYIAQAELDDYIGESSDLGKFINGLVFNSRKVKNSALEYEYQELLTQTKQTRSALRDLTRKVFDLESQTTAEIYEESKKTIKQLESLYKDLENRIKEAEKQLGSDQVKKAEEKQEALAKLKKKKETQTLLSKNIWQLTSRIDGEVSDFNILVGRINKLLESVDDEDRFPKISYDKKSELEKKYQSVQAGISKTLQDIEKVQTEVDKFAQEVKVHSKLLEKKDDAKEALAKAKEKLSKLEEKQESLKKVRDERDGLLSILVNGVVQARDKYKEIIDTFSEDKTQVLSDISFQAQLLFNEDKLLKGAGEILDNRKVRNVEEELAKLTESYKSVVEENEGEAEEDSDSKVGKLVAETRKLSEELTESVRHTSAVDNSSLYDLLYENYFSLVPTVKYKNVPLAKSSLGQKATVLIKIYLAEGTTPIIIDSHDDHLDNEYIMDELILSIREAKKFRQVILVSNNGNVVINSDAEQLVIADRSDDGEISYISGSIENPKIRKRALKVLEGGKKAFKKRQQKYRLN